MCSTMTTKLLAALVAGATMIGPALAGCPGPNQSALDNALCKAMHSECVMPILGSERGPIPVAGPRHDEFELCAHRVFNKFYPNTYPE